MSWSTRALYGDIYAIGMGNADQFLASETDHLYWTEAVGQA